MDERELTDLLGRHASKHSVPGAALGIVREGLVTTACYGVTNVDTGVPVTSETLFSVGSLTKSMVATTIARLAQTERLSLSDPVSEHVPELRGCGWAESATLRDLLANRSGLPLRAGLEFGFEDRVDRDDGALSRLVADLAESEPAVAFWSYSNVGYCVLGRVIETTTGLPWEAAMRPVLDGAGMDETTFVTDSSALVRRASGHEVTADGPAPVEPLVSRAYGPAGLTTVSTIGNLLRFASWHLEDSSLAAMRDVQARVPIYGWLDAWCLGWGWFDWAGGPVWGWDGLINGERSFLRLVPDRKAAVVLLTNSATGRAMYRALFAELMGPMFGIKVPAMRLDVAPDAAGDLSRFVGVYAWPDHRVEVKAAERRLRITSDEGEWEAVPLDERTFLVDPADPDNPTVTFGQYDVRGRPHVLYEMLWGLPRLDD